MSLRSWLSTLEVELRRHGLPAGQVASVVDDAWSHLRDSAEDPYTAFGTPEHYASAVAESLTAPGSSRGRRIGPVRLEVAGVGKRFGRRQVLRDVNLTVRAGQIAAVVGANGSGKSTLLRICAGLCRADEGDVIVHGGVSYSPQESGTAPYLLPDEHFVLVGAGQGRSRAAAREQGRLWAARLGWQSVVPTPARLLSGGTRQKLNLVLSTMTGADVLLLDEPYQGFDRGAYVNLWEQLWGLRDEGRAIVIVTHLLNQLDHVDTVLDLGEAA